MNSAVARKALVSAVCLVTATGCSTLGVSAPKFGSKRDLTKSQISMARLTERHGQADYAVRMYQTILAKEPNNQVAHHRLGVIAAKQAQFDEAEEHFKRALASGPANAELLTDVGYMLYLQSKLDAAEKTLQKALAEDPAYKRARTNLALVLGEQGRFDESLAEFKKVVSEAEAYANLAYVRAQHGDLEGAQMAYHRALSMNNQLRPAAEALIQISQRQKAPAGQLAQTEGNSTNSAPRTARPSRYGDLPEIGAEESNRAGNRSQLPELAGPMERSQHGVRQESVAAQPQRHDEDRQLADLIVGFEALPQNERGSAKQGNESMAAKKSNSTPPAESQDSYDGIELTHASAPSPANVAARPMLTSHRGSAHKPMVVQVGEQSPVPAARAQKPASATAQPTPTSFALPETLGPTRILDRWPSAEARDDSTGPAAPRQAAPDDRLSEILAAEPHRILAR